MEHFLLETILTVFDWLMITFDQTSITSQQFMLYPRRTTKRPTIYQTQTSVSIWILEPIWKKNKVVKRRRPNFGIAPLSQIILAPPLTHHWPPSRPNTWCWVNGANPWIASGEVWWVICRNCDFDSSGLNCCYILETNNPPTGIPLYVIGGCMPSIG